MRIYRCENKNSRLCVKCFKEENKKISVTVIVDTWWSQYSFCDKHAYEFVNK